MLSEHEVSDVALDAAIELDEKTRNLQPECKNLKLIADHFDNVITNYLHDGKGYGFLSDLLVIFKSTMAAGYAPADLQPIKDHMERLMVVCYHIRQICSAGKLSENEQEIAKKLLDFLIKYSERVVCHRHISYLCA